MISDERLAALHAYTRKHSVNWPLYIAVRLLFVPFFLVYFRLSRTGRDHARHVKGGLIVAANHRSFLDPFIVGACLPWRRPMNYVAKVELFQKPVQAWFLSRLGAFPIRRGDSDEESMETARMVVERGGTLCIFPEGTRHPQRQPRRPEARGRQAGAADRRADPADRGDRHRRGAPRLAHQAAQGEGPLRPGDDLPAGRGALEGAGRNRDRRGSGPTSCCSGKTWEGCRRCAAPP